MKYQCSKCSEFFEKNKSQRNLWCKKCNAQNNKDWREKNKEILKVKRKEYVKTHPEIINAAQIRHLKKYRDRENKKRRIAYQNPEVRKRKYAYSNRRRQDFPEIRLIAITRISIWQAMFRGCSVKRAEKILGCTLEEYKNYLTKQFLEGMNWDNYGRTGWQIDHIKPISEFDILEKNQSKKAFHFSNTRPLWAKDNHIRKN